MKKLIIHCFLLVFLTSPCSAKDFIVEVVEEQYKEVQHYSKLSYAPYIYHSIHTCFKNNSKLIVLTGKNHAYRQWLRQYIAQNKYFVIQVPENDNNTFISSKVYKIDVTQIHPIKLSLINGKDQFKIKRADGFDQDQVQPEKKRLEKNQESREATAEKAAQERLDKKEAEQKRLEQEKIQKAEAKRKAAEGQEQQEEAEKRRLEREKELRAKADKDALEEQERREAAEKRQSERDKQLIAKAEQEALEEQKRREAADKRWLEREKELRARIAKEALAEQMRREKADKRWIQRKRWLKASRYYN
ncbi:MAG: hypothetical protein K8R67_12480 [Desulfobacteraceae bacterium]|nr:hypothetical protein [Desulfobacteraceae bacterium]